MITRGLIMLKKFQIESRRDFRFSQYSKGEAVGLGDSFVSIMRKRVKDKNKPKALSI